MAISSPFERISIVISIAVIGSATTGTGLASMIPVLGILFFIGCAFLGMRIGWKRGKNIKRSRSELQRIDTIKVALDAARVRQIAREETDGRWQRDYGDEAVGYVHSDAITSSTGIGFGIRVEEDSGGSTVTVFPYARGMSLSEEVHIGVHGYGGLDFAVDALSNARAWAKIAPVRRRIIDRLKAHATAPIVTEVLD